jgi:hypothetical protein
VEFSARRQRFRATFSHQRPLYREAGFGFPRLVMDEVFAHADCMALQPSVALPFPLRDGNRKQDQPEWYVNIFCHSSSLPFRAGAPRRSRQTSISRVVLVLFLWCHFRALTPPCPTTRRHHPMPLPSYLGIHVSGRSYQVQESA